jgi:hypothetical protein
MRAGAAKFRGLLIVRCSGGGYLTTNNSGRCPDRLFAWRFARHCTLTITTRPTEIICVFGATSGP